MGTPCVILTSTMSFKKFKKLFIAISDLSNSDSTLRLINQIQSNVEASVSSIIALTQNDSQILSNVPIQAGMVNIISHKLNKQLSGWKLTRCDTFCQIKDSQANNPSPHLHLFLETTADATIDIEVF